MSLQLCLQKWKFMINFESMGARLVSRMSEIIMHAYK